MAKVFVGDEALDDLVDEENKKNTLEERERYTRACSGSSWLGQLMQGAFNYEGKCEFDVDYLEASRFINSKLDEKSRSELLFEEEFRGRDNDRFVLELSLCGEDYASDDTEETKLYNREQVVNLSKASRVALLRVFMLNKQMNWLRSVMKDTYQDSLMNWQLPLNHRISDGSTTSRYGKSHWPKNASTLKACKRMSGPFDPTLLTQAIGGNVRLYNNQAELYQFVTRLRDAQ